MAKGPKKTAAVRSLAKALSHSLHPTYLLGPDGQLLFANPALAKVLGVTEEFLTNKLLGASCHSPLSEVTADGSGFPSQEVSLLAAALSCPAIPAGQRSAVGRFKLPGLATAHGNATRDAEWERLSLRMDGSRNPSILNILFPSRQAPAVDAERSEASTGIDALHQALFSLRRRYSNAHTLLPLLGQSPLAIRAMSQVQAAIASPCPTCIVGPLGSGKREVARSIFVGRWKNQSGTAPGSQLFPIDCRLMDTSLLTNMLEVMEDAQPRGTAGKKQTLLLERVDLLPSETYGVLLEHLMRSKSESILSTSLRPLLECHTKEKLWLQIVSYLDIQTVNISPLADRPEDLPLLIQSILLQMHSNKRIESIPVVEPAALEMMQAYRWPNNIRELRQALEEACQTSTDKIEIRSLPVAIRSFASHVESSARTNEPLNLDAILLDVEQTILHEVLSRFPGNRALAARQLGISRARLLRRLEQLGIRLRDEDAESTKAEVEGTNPRKGKDTKQPKEQALEIGMEPTERRSPSRDEEVEFVEIDFEEYEGDPS